LKGNFDQNKKNILSDIAYKTDFRFLVLTFLLRKVYHLDLGLGESGAVWFIVVGLRLKVSVNIVDRLLCA